jgi:hypothetical protein
MQSLTNFFKQFKPNDTDKAGSSACAPVLLGSGAGGDGYKVHDLVVKCFWCCGNPTLVRFNGAQGFSTGNICKTCKKPYRDQGRGIHMLNEELALNQKVLTMLTPDIVEKYTPIIDQNDKTKKYKNCKRTIKLFKQMPHIVSKGGDFACDLFAVISAHHNRRSQNNNAIEIMKTIIRSPTEQNVFVLKLIDCMFQVCNGLKNNSMYHHDIKPENIFVSLTQNKLNVVLGDYGLMGLNRNHPAGTRGYTGFNPGQCPRFIDPDVWCVSGSPLCAKLKKHRSSSVYYFEKSWDRTLYSIAKTCYDAFALSNNHFLLETTCLFCLWNIWNNKSFDLQIFDLKNTDFLNDVGIDTGQFDTEFTDLMRTTVYGGGDITSMKPSVDIPIPSSVTYHKKITMKRWNDISDKDRDEYFQLDRCYETRYSLPFLDLAEEQAENVKKYINDIHDPMGEGPDEAEGAEVQFPKFLTVKKETQQEGGGSSSSRASKWASIALGAVVTLVASLVKR